MVVVFIERLILYFFCCLFVLVNKIYIFIVLSVHNVHVEFVDLSNYFAYSFKKLKN